MITCYKIEQIKYDNTTQFNIWITEVGCLPIVFEYDDNGLLISGRTIRLLNVSYTEDTLQALYNFCITHPSLIDITTNIMEGELLLDAQGTRLKQLKSQYLSAVTIHIVNGVSFDINLNSLEGQRLLQIILIAKSQSQEFQYNTQTFLMNIQQNGIVKTIKAILYNWVWQYLFGSLVDYQQGVDAEFRQYTYQINNAPDIASLNAININFRHPNGLQVSVNEAIDYILDSPQEQVPQAVRDSLIANNKKIFRYVESSDLTNLTHSLFNV